MPSSKRLTASRLWCAYGSIQEAWWCLLDLNMPGVGGVQVLQTVAAEGPLAQRHVFIVMTARTLTLPCGLAELLTRLHIPVIAKPFDLEQVVAAVAHAALRLAAASD